MQERKELVKAIIDLVKLIPKGRVTNYGAIAESLGMKSSARFVGWALKGNDIKKSVPAHRVVNRNGLLTGRHHFSPPEKMQQLLEAEGVQVVDNQVVEFKKLFWNPQDVLN